MVVFELLAVTLGIGLLIWTVWLLVGSKDSTISVLRAYADLTERSQKTLTKQEVNATENLLNATVLYSEAEKSFNTVLDSQNKFNSELVSTFRKTLDDFSRYVEFNLKNKYDEKFNQFIVDFSELLNEIKEFERHLTELAEWDKYQDKEFVDMIEHTKGVLDSFNNFKKDLENAQKDVSTTETESRQQT